MAMLLSVSAATSTCAALPGAYLHYLYLRVSDHSSCRLASHLSRLHGALAVVSATTVSRVKSLFMMQQKGMTARGFC
jgi:hypothetical protein